MDRKSHKQHPCAANNIEFRASSIRKAELRLAAKALPCFFLHFPTGMNMDMGMGGVSNGQMGFEKTRGEWTDEMREDRKTGGQVVAHSPKEHISDEPKPFRALFVIVTQVAP